MTIAPTRQEIFNKAYLGVIAQGGPSKGNCGCSYAGANGRACGVGQLVDKATAMAWDSAYDTSIDVIIKDGWADRCGFDWMDDHIVLLMDVQYAHDSASTNTAFIRQFTHSMSKVAEDHGLTMPANQSIGESQ